MGGSKRCAQRKHAAGLKSKELILSPVSVAAHENRRKAGSIQWHSCKGQRWHLRMKAFVPLAQMPWTFENQVSTRLSSKDDLYLARIGMSSGFHFKFSHQTDSLEYCIWSFKSTQLRTKHNPGTEDRQRQQQCRNTYGARCRMIQNASFTKHHWSI